MNNLSRCKTKELWESSGPGFICKTCPNITPEVKSGLAVEVKKNSPQQMLLAPQHSRYWLDDKVPCWYIDITYAKTESYHARISRLWIVIHWQTSADKNLYYQREDKGMGVLCLTWERQKEDLQKAVTIHNWFQETLCLWMFLLKALQWAEFHGKCLIFPFTCTHSVGPLQFQYDSGKVAIAIGSSKLHCEFCGSKRWKLT